MWFLHYYYHNHDLLATACCLQLLLMITILLHAGSSQIKAFTSIPGKDKRKASVSADQPHKRLREELTNRDYCEGKLLTRENKHY